jgi:hypothetical protein
MSGQTLRHSVSHTLRIIPIIVVMIEVPAPIAVISVPPVVAATAD